MKNTPSVIVFILATFLVGCSTIPSHQASSGPPPAPANSTSLTPADSTQARQAATSFLQAIGNEDWSAVAKFWPTNARVRFDDIFNARTKSLVGGLDIIALGTPYKKASDPSLVFVPYEVRFRNGGTQRNSLRIKQRADGDWVWIGGF